MIRKLIFALAAASLSACAAGVPGPATPAGGAAATTAVDAIALRYQELRLFAQLLLPLLPEPRAAQIRAAGARLDRALELARVAAGLADRRAAEERARRALAEYAAATGS